MTSYWPHPPALPWHKRQWVRITLMVAAIIVIGAGAIIMFGLLGFSYGPGLLLVAIFFALLPVPFLLGGVYWLTRYDPAPWYYFAFSVGWGAFVATFIALILNEIGGALVEDPNSSDEIDTNTAVFIAPPVEETAKAVPLFLMLLATVFGRRIITGVVTGVVYAVAVAVGFAFTENVLYFGAAYLEGAEDGAGAPALIAVFVFRAVLSPFAHPLFTVFIGIGVGVAARTRHTWLRILAPLAGLGVAIGLHAAWNGMASTGDLRVLGAGYALIMLPLLAGVIAFSIYMRAREGRSTQRVLPQYAAAGWFSARDVANLATMRERVAARRWIRSITGHQGVRAVARMQAAATQLAMLREDASKGAVHRGFDQRERELLHKISTTTQWMHRVAVFQQGRAELHWRYLHQHMYTPSVHAYY